MTPALSANWTWVPAHVTRGHRVASGLNGNPRFPGGTLAMQRPYFAQRGLDLGRFHGGTLNLRIAPRHAVVKRPRLTFEQVRWHPEDPPETFSFFDAQLRHDGHIVDALVYRPHPQTKPTHFQADDILELLAPFVPGLGYGIAVDLATDPSQMVLE